MERSASGRAPSSWGRKSGARPSLWMKSVVAPRGVNDQPWFEPWQVSQVRAFVPSCWKKELVRSMVPVVVTVSAIPPS